MTDVWIIQTHANKTNGPFDPTVFGTFERAQSRCLDRVTSEHYAKDPGEILAMQSAIATWTEADYHNSIKTPNGDYTLHLYKEYVFS